MKKKILVTGSNGFIASRLTQKLYQYNKYDCFFLSRNPISPNSFKIRNYNLLDLQSEKALVDLHAVIHLAALVPEPKNKTVLIRYVDANIKYTKNLLDFAQKKNVKKFVYVSSFSIFDGIGVSQIDETTIPAPLSIYSQTKLAAEYLVLSYKEKFANGVVILRPAFTFGNGMKQKRMIPFIINKLINDESLDIYEPQKTLELSYVSDVCTAIINSIDAAERYLIANLVNDVMSKREMVEILKEKTKSKSTISYLAGTDSFSQIRKVSENKYSELLHFTDPTRFLRSIEEML